MKPIKESVPNEAVLRTKLNENWSQFESDITQALGSLEAEYIQIRQRQRIGWIYIVLSLVAASFVMLLIEIDATPFPFVVEVIFFLFLFSIPCIVGFRLTRDPQHVVARFNLRMNSVLFPKLLSLFNVTGSYIIPTLDKSRFRTNDHETQTQEIRDSLAKEIATIDFVGDLRDTNKKHFSPEVQQVRDLLRHSELVTEPCNRILVDDMLHIQWRTDRTLFITELRLKQVTGHGKDQRTKHIFAGYFVSFDLGTNLQGKTFISTEGDTKGFGHQSFWKKMTSTGIQETQLEWNEFERLLHVASDNPTEARYVLSTDFMADLYDWWKDKKRNIRISFINSRMYMLFPDTDIRFEKTVPSLSTADLQAYAMSIAVPLMHILHLTEDVKQ